MITQVTSLKDKRIVQAPGLLLAKWRSSLAHQHQHGIILVTALVILLVMSLIAVTAMQGAVQGERMASNARRGDQAFQWAEMALRYADSRIQNDAIATIATVNYGYCDLATYWIEGFCWDGKRTKDCSQSPPADLTESATTCTPQIQTVPSITAKYVAETIESVGSIEVNADRPTTYRVTARGGEGDAAVILQITSQKKL